MPSVIHMFEGRGRSLDASRAFSSCIHTTAVLKPTSTHHPRHPASTVSLQRDCSTPVNVSSKLSTTTMPRAAANKKKASTLDKAYSGRVAKHQQKANARPTRASAKIASLQRANAVPLPTFHPFLQLPREIRDMVYEHALPGSSRQPIKPTMVLDDISGLSLLQVNKQIHEEASAALGRTAPVNMKYCETTTNALVNAVRVNIQIMDVVEFYESATRGETLRSALAALRRHVQSFVSGSASKKWDDKTRWATVDFNDLFHETIFESSGLNIDDAQLKTDAEDRMEEILRMKKDTITEWTVAVGLLGNLVDQTAELQNSVAAFKAKCEGYGFTFDVRR
ncbi:uncharacterized protein BDZ99DRAFT_483734 [Mytilinidion resinicola]|uniref:Uncharacterized protein n=1 Tax=Mytilinidion resinicola TaxID=574789 RepID=A0A6A6XY73_9PEZI|nr:uncharacterized protein BDZ99DRAFT_483734 [Mytilinidion resinicola]KAF2801506.1 hypothetical protein BDZ99DRAFT_483734 [Mytilinidion resinicola]